MVIIRSKKILYRVLKSGLDSIMTTKLSPGFHLYFRKFKVAWIVQRLSSRLFVLEMSGILSDSYCTKCF